MHRSSRRHSKSRRRTDEYNLKYDEIFTLDKSLKSKYIFNVASIIAFGSVVMTFVGVNYYLSKGMHSYGQGDTPIFPLWAWGLILATILLIVLAGIREKYSKK